MRVSAGPGRASGLSSIFQQLPEAPPPVGPVGCEPLEAGRMCASSRWASSMTSATEPPVRYRSSQSEDSEYSLTRGPSAHSRISLNAPLVMTMASSRSEGLATDSR